MPTALRLLGAAPPPAADVPPWLAKGFRPLFLLAGVHAALIVPLWLLVRAGSVRPAGYLSPSVWHAHELIFGFAAAVIAGFLLTAAGNWTGRETAVGGPLIALVVTWLAGRVALVAAPWLPGGVVAVADLAFLPALALVIGRVLVAARSHRNLGLLAIVAVLWLMNLAIHLDVLGVAPGWSWRATRGAVELVVLLILVMAARVFPMFTRNATQVASIRSIVALDRATAAAMAALVIVDVAWPGWRGSAALAGLTAILALARSVPWGARHARRLPLLWILHACHAFIVVGLGLRALGEVWPAAALVGWLHALTVGGIGCGTLGMMARVSLGHSGRALVAGAPVTAAFGALVLAAVVRVGAPLLGARYPTALNVAGGLWTLAFAVFVLAYARILVEPRADGRPG